MKQSGSVSSSLRRRKHAAGDSNEFSSLLSPEVEGRDPLVEAGFVVVFFFSHVRSEEEAFFFFLFVRLMFSSFN